MLKVSPKNQRHLSPLSFVEEGFETNEAVSKQLSGGKPAIFALNEEKAAEGEVLIAFASSVTDGGYEGYYNVDKKGNVKLIMVVSGRMWTGTYTINMRKGDNQADVIFTPSGSGTTRRFHGPIVPVAGADYNKRSNPI